MRKLCIVLFCLIISNAKAQTLYTISGIITQTASYCQGAAPSEELLNKLSTPKPLANKTIYIKQISSNKYKAKVIAQFTTDSLGKFEIKLPAGNYCLIDNYKVKAFRSKKSNKLFVYDNRCLRKQYEQCDLSLTINNADQKNVSINYHTYCNWDKPCIRYLGQLVP
jgi:hypothetical protein